MKVSIETSLGELKAHDSTVRNWLCKRDEYLLKWIRENFPKPPPESHWDAVTVTRLALQQFDKDCPTPSIVPK